VDELLVAAQRSARAAGWRFWAYRNEIHAGEIVLFIEGPLEPAEGQRAPRVFGDEIERLRDLSRRFEPVRSLVDYPLGEEED